MIIWLLRQQAAKLWLMLMFLCLLVLNSISVPHVQAQIVSVSATLFDAAYAVKLQQDSNILVAGSSYNGSNLDFALARYIGDAVSQIYYVKSDAKGANDGSSWTNAYTDLQSALSVASSDDKIWVVAGTYKPTKGTDRTISFVLKNGVAIYGGFVGIETLYTQRNPTTNVTILSGDIGVVGDISDNSYHVVVGSNTNSSATMDGFTILSGNANKGDSPDNSPDNMGGGMLNEGGSPTLTNIIFSSNTAFYGGGAMANGSYASPALTDVIFNDNTASNFGGGMHNLTFSNPSLTNVTFSRNIAVDGGGMFNQVYSSPILINVAFSENTGSFGGGLANHESSLSLTNVTFSGNLASYGGGMFNSNSSSILMNITFSGNTATNLGGGMYNYSSSPSLTDVTFIDNTANEGGGMYNEIYSSPSLTNVTISGNAASTYGGGMYNELSSSPTICNTIFWGNTATSEGSQIHNYDGNSSPVVSNSVIEGECPVGSTCTNIITANPVFGALGNYGGFTQTLPLLAGSSAINAGNDANCPATDQRGVSRPQGAHCDIGAYEFEASTLTLHSQGSNDGHLFELSKNSNVGWRFNATSSRLYVGDDQRNRQYRAILSFDTSSLPDDAVILSATLNVKRMRTIGTNPFDTHGALLVEIGSPCFGSSCNLEASDFQAGAQAIASNLSSASTANWHSAVLDAGVYPYINLTGKTQFRLRFELEDNNDRGMDAIQFLSGNAPPNDRPQLIIEYYVP